MKLTAAFSGIKLTYKICDIDISFFSNNDLNHMNLAGNLLAVLYFINSGLLYNACKCDV